MDGHEARWPASALAASVVSPSGFAVRPQDGEIRVVLCSPPTAKPDGWQAYALTVYEKQPRRKGDPFVYAETRVRWALRCAAVNVSNGRQCEHDAGDRELCNTHRAMSPDRIQHVERPSAQAILAVPLPAVR